MRYQWDWADFFQKEISPGLTLEHGYHDLIALPFMQSLQVIVTRVPAFAHEQWQAFHHWLVDCTHYHATSWLLISHLIREHMHEVRQVLGFDLDHAADRMQTMLQDRTPAQQFALMACLHHFARTSHKANMLLTYLLKQGDADAQHMKAVLKFYNRLTDRQRDVAMWTAHGLTNQEIAEKLVIERSVVAEHLTAIYSRFTEAIEFQPDPRGTRFRLIHWLTRLFAAHPYLLADRDH